MKKLFFLLAFFAFTITSVFSQKSEIGVLGGTSFYIGDISHSTIFSECGYSFGVIYRYNISPRWAVKANVIFAEIHASDAKSNNNYERNLSFRSPITEISAQMELNFFKLYNQKGYNRFSPYIFGGVALFSFNPQTEYNGTYYDLQPFGTEGQIIDDGKKEYALCSFAVPFGIGFRFNIGRYISLGAEWGMRFTCTDYLDDVCSVYYDNGALRTYGGDMLANLADRSPEIGGEIHEAGTQRGNFKTTDFYSFCGATLTFKIGNENKVCQIKEKVNTRRKLGRKR